MARLTKHRTASAAACAPTPAVLPAPSSSLPESAPVHFGLTEDANAHWPCEAVALDLPAVFVAAAVVAEASPSKRGDARALMRRIAPAVAFAATGPIILTGTR